MSKPLPAFRTLDSQLVFKTEEMLRALRFLAARRLVTRRHEAVIRRLHALHVRLQLMYTNYKLQTKLSNFININSLKFK
jgi:hypothetical protein